jgi:hypothetical protein
MKGFPNFLVALALMALASSLASAFDPAPLQDFCVAVNTSTDACMYTFFDIIVIIIMFFRRHLMHLDCYFSSMGSTYQCNYLGARD